MPVSSATWNLRPSPAALLLLGSRPAGKDENLRPLRETAMPLQHDQCRSHASRQGFISGQGHRCRGMGIEHSRRPLPIIQMHDFQAGPCNHRVRPNIILCRCPLRGIAQESDHGCTHLERLGRLCVLLPCTHAHTARRGDEVQHSHELRLLIRTSLVARCHNSHLSKPLPRL